MCDADRAHNLEENPVERFGEMVVGLMAVYRGRLAEGVVGWWYQRRLMERNYFDFPEGRFRNGRMCFVMTEKSCA
jgi:hypothetical protein